MNEIQMIECQSSTSVKHTAVEDQRVTVAPPTELAQTTSTEKQTSMSPEMAEVIKTAIITVTGGICFISFLYFTQGRSVKVSGSVKSFKFMASISQAVASAA